MDRRQKKTRAAIFSAFSRLLESRPYEKITVQNIIDAADIGRSTFYAHFETKDDLLQSICDEIFHHVFSQELPQEAILESSDGSKGLELKLGHILYHLDEHRAVLSLILSGPSGEPFLQSFRDYLQELFSRYPGRPCESLPEDYYLHHLVSSFSETAVWWLTEPRQYTPEEMAGFFMSVTGHAASND